MTPSGSIRVRAARWPIRAASNREIEDVGDRGGGLQMFESMACGTATRKVTITLEEAQLERVRPLAQRSLRQGKPDGRPCTPSNSWFRVLPEQRDRRHGISPRFVTTFVDMAHVVPWRGR